MRLVRTPWVVALAALVLLASGSQALASVFINPPETDPLATGWQSPFPYQRNVLLDFATDPATWDDDPVQGKDLIPGVNADMEGTLDPALYPSDWFRLSGDISWVNGALVVSGVNQSAQIAWHMDNLPPPGDHKNIWEEVVYRATGEWEDEAYVIPSSGEWELLGEREELLGIGDWTVYNAFEEIRPNPDGETFIWNIFTDDDGGTVTIDSWHIATECVPEPATGALFMLGLAGLAVIRRRRS